MFKKKDVDISSIVKKSFQDSMKTHGLLKEEEEQVDTQSVGSKEAFTDEFNVEKHLSYLKITPKQWGVKGTIEANELDAIVDAVVGGEASGINRFKTALINMNQILGKKPGSFGFPGGQTTDESLSNVRSLFSSLQLNYLFHAIIKN